MIFISSKRPQIISTNMISIHSQNPLTLVIFPFTIDLWSFYWFDVNHLEGHSYLHLRVKEEPDNWWTKTRVEDIWVLGCRCELTLIKEEKERKNKFETSKNSFLLLYLYQEFPCLKTNAVRLFNGCNLKNPERWPEIK